MTADRPNLVVLYVPHFVPESERGHGYYRAVPPLSQLALAGPLRDAGYEVEILDGRWETRWKERLSAAADRLACLGISSLTGPAVSDGLEVAGYLRGLRPEVPIVWGGWHATFAAEQAVQDPRVDVVVRGIAEQSFVELLGALRSGAPLHGVPGVTFRENGRVTSTPERPPADLSRFPPPAYELIDPARYITSTGDGRRMAGAIYSRGCPYACDFCLDSRNKVLSVPIDRMIADIEYWVSHGADFIRFFDGNFFLGRQRILDFCQAVLARGLERRFRWAATGVGHRMARLEDDVLALLARAGLDQVAIGAESGSDELLRAITNKTTVADTTESVRRLARHGINSYLFFVVGYPGEPDDALDRTFDLVLELKRINPRIEFFLNFTTPLPGSEVYRVAVERGLVQAPETFEAWSRFDYLRPNLPAAPGYAARVHRFIRYCGIAFPGTVAAGSMRERIRAPLRSMARWRLEHRTFRYPVELALQDALAALAAPRS